MSGCLCRLQWRCTADEVLYVFDAWLPEQQPHHLHVATPATAAKQTAATGIGKSGHSTCPVAFTYMNFS